MSFILDALRKSEAERQRNRAPGIADMQRAGNKRGRSIWLPLAALLAGLNIALLGLLWYSSERPPEGAQPEQAITIPPPTAPPVTSPANNSRSLSDEMAPDEPARYAAIAPPESVPQPAADDIEIPPQPTAGRIPTVRQAVLDGTLSVRSLRLELHVFSDNPAERFVFINTSRYGEGDQTSEGPVVRTIREDGVVLRYQGRDFLLARE